MEAWTDVSSWGGRTCGAFVVDDGGIQTVELSGLIQGTCAEIALMEHVIETLQCEFLLHHDLTHLPLFIGTGRRLVRTLHELTIAYGVTLKADGRNFRQYKQCHHAARVAVGIYGTNHPMVRQLKATGDSVSREQRLHYLREKNAGVQLRGGFDCDHLSRLQLRHPENTI